MNKPLKGFISYSHENKKEKDRLIKFLDVMEQENVLKTWHDGDIIAGDAARQEDILKEVATSDLLLFLISADSLASEGCKKELEEALKRDIKVIPILLEHCDWEHHQLSGNEGLPDKFKPISKWEDKSEGWQNVVDGIRKAVEKIKSQTDPSSGRSEEDLRAELAFHRANVRFSYDELEEAIEAYSESIHLKPNSAVTYNNRGVAYSKQDDFNLAIADYTKAIELKPDDAHAYINRGNAYSRIGKFQNAIEDYNRAIQLRPNYADAYFNRGVTYYKKGDYNRAIEDYNKAIEIQPDNDKAYHNRGETLLHLNEMEKAKADLITAKEMGADIVAAFRIDYESVAVFEQKTGIQLPPDIAKMLTPP